MQHSELAIELGNVRVDEVEVERSDVAHEVVDELERANVDVDVGKMGPPNTYTGYKECVSANPRCKTNNSAAISTLNPTPIERGDTQQELADFEDNSDDDYSCGDEDEYEDESDLFAENSDEDDLGALNVDEEGIASYPTFNPEVDFKGKINLSLGLKFPSTYVFRKALRYHAIECGYNYYYLHNGRSRISVYCYNRCDCVKSKARIVNCICGKDKKCYFKYWRENPNWELKAFKKRVNRELGCEVKYSKCYMAKRIAKKMIVGDASEEYSRVWDYAEAIRRFNLGSTAIVKCIGIETPPPLFQRMYICLPVCKEGFVAGCRRIIGVDGAHLKGPFPGVLMTDVGKDGNNNIFPVPWAVVETENVESWTWFLNLLVEDLKSVNPSSSCVEAGCEDFTFMSDRQKLKLGSTVGIFELISRSSFLESCTNITFGKQQELTIRHAFSSRSKSGMLFNNYCESFNNVLVEARGKPIISLMEWIRRYVMQRSASKREGLSNFKGVLMPAITKMIERNSKEIYGLRVIPVDVSEFELDDDEECYVVKLTNKTCLCGSWNLLSIPCKHAMACIIIRKLDPSEFVHEAYHVETYAKTYAPKFYGMPGHKMWPTTTLAKPLPPPFRKMPGRPKMRKRKKEADEGKGCKKPLSAVREFKQRRCGNCGDLGHYKKGCKNPAKPQPTKTKSKGGRPKMGTSSTQQSTPNDVPCSSSQQTQSAPAASTSCVVDQLSQI
ncbi:uncharacterized protein LOC130810730 [Amaranthus tricolor]|uniref:uncharacterized protein LOC130810730 n=1 Tax=Amaranthus tricolor TaxID=29722 RepID=UPI0025849681|nr:uncharacterized protein LOC130810730 [Amaranthus tricolor]